MTSTTPLAGFAELYEQHYEAVFRAALRVTGNPADAEDVLQTVFGHRRPPSLLCAAAYAPLKVPGATARLPLHLSLQPVSDPVKPDGHVVPLQLEHPGQFFDRQPLDVTQQE